MATRHLARDHRSAGRPVRLPPEPQRLDLAVVVGHPLPWPAIETGTRRAARELRTGADALAAVARAILTTDTVIKVRTQEVTRAGETVRLTGFAKGAAMIGPNVATMRAFVLTDA